MKASRTYWARQRNAYSHTQQSEKMKIEIIERDWPWTSPELSITRQSCWQTVALLCRERKKHTDQRQDLFTACRPWSIFRDHLQGWWRRFQWRGLSRHLANLLRHQQVVLQDDADCRKCHEQEVAEEFGAITSSEKWASKRLANCRIVRTSSSYLNVTEWFRKWSWNINTINEFRSGSCKVQCLNVVVLGWYEQRPTSRKICPLDWVGFLVGQCALCSPS